MVQLFEEQVLRTPDHIAIRCEGKELTYCQLNEQANQLAHRLRQHFVLKNGMELEPDTLVPIIIERGLEIWIGLLGILKAGAAFVPISSVYPEERIQFILKDCKSSIVLTQHSLITKLHHLDDGITSRIEFLCIDNKEEESFSTENLLSKTQPFHLAYVMYTSGSTGMPKGVLIQHNSVVNLLGSIKDYLQVKSTDIFLGITEYTFDISILDLFLPLIVGAKCIILKHIAALNVAAIIKTIKNEKITIMQATPSMWQLLINAGWQSNKPIKILSGGEVLPSSLANQLLQQHHHVWNVYGPTETTIWSTIFKVEKPVDSCRVPIGKPLANTSLLIIKNNKLTPEGDIGELYIGGGGVARGYLNRSDPNEKVFTLHPLGLSVDRFYKTGDQVRQLANGDLEFLGRLDNQVKIRGHRVELSEIEFQLLRHPSVLSAVVLVNSKDVSNQLVAYVILKNKSTTVNEITGFLQKNILTHMVPTAFQFLEAFPLTNNGKVDKKHLSALHHDFLYVNEQYIAPSSETEKKVMSIFSNVLKKDIDSLGIRANFFALGGHSLLVIQLLLRLRQALHVELSMNDVFKFPTVMDLSQNISNQTKLIAANPLMTRENNTPLQLSSSQKRIWFLSQLYPGNPFYNCAFSLRLIGEINLLALKRAFVKLIERHEILRTNFKQELGSIVQNITQTKDIDFHLLKEPLSSDIQDTIDLEAQKPFDLANDKSLMRVRLLHVSENDHLLLITFHHIIIDDWSMSVFYNELNSLYKAYVSNQSSELAPLFWQYADFSNWQQTCLSSDKLKTQLAYWGEQLAELAPLELPLDYHRPLVPTYRGRSIEVKLPLDLYRQLKIVSSQESVTLFTILYSIFTIVLGHYSNQEDVAIGIPVAGRTLVEVEDLLGFFVNTLILRGDLAGSPDFYGLLQRNHAMILAAFANQEAPLEQVIDILQVKREVAKNSLFQVMFVFQNAPDVQLNFPGIKAEALVAKHNTVKFDLCLVLNENKEGISGYIEYSTDIFKEGTIQNLWQHFTNVFFQLLANPQKPVMSHGLLSVTQQKELLQQLTLNTASYPSDKTLSQLFEEQVKSTPDKMAVSYQNQQVSYGELNAKANQLARHLQHEYFMHYKKSIAPDVLIPISMDRSIDMIVSVLAILKAGAAYVPVDINYPEERIGIMLRNCGETLLLTQTQLTPLFQSLTKKLYQIPPLQFVDNILLENNFSQFNLEPISQSHHLAYVIYTSGSTGLPKGVMVPHRGVINTILNQIKIFPIQENSRILQLASFSFDSAVSEMFRALLSGSTLILCSKEELVPGAILADTLKKQKISIVTIPPAALNIMPLDSYPDLQVLVTAGEACPLDLMQRWSKHYRFLNAYGPTETSICATMAVFSPIDKVVSIGRPLENVNVYILDKFLQLVPESMVGELYIGGAGVARGYLHRDDLTQERFIKNPFTVDPDDKLYRTGDLVRQLNDGRLEFIGRNDNQVKIRGFRIELGEVQAKLQLHPSIKQSVVLIKNDDNDIKLIAYLVLEENEVINAHELRLFLLHKLPDYMIPSGYVILPFIPLTFNRKIDKQKLLIQKINLLTNNDKYITPRDTVEFILLKFWEKILKRNSISVKDDFFSLGGHSLLLVALAAHIENEFKVKISLAKIFENLTIEKLAALIATKGSISHSIGLIKIKDSGTKPPLFCIHETLGTVFIYNSLAHHLNPNIPVYGIQDPYLGMNKHFTSISEMARHYIKLIKSVQPLGPYHLSGWCLGGVIAFEIALQLQAEGDVIDNVIMLDSVTDNLLSLLPNADRAKKIKEMLIANEIIAPLKHSNSMDEWIGSTVKEILHRIKLIRNYKPKFYSGKTTLIKATEKKEEYDLVTPTKDNGWLQYVSNLEVYYSTGDHYDIIKEPHVQRVAEIINKVLL